MVSSRVLIASIFLISAAAAQHLVYPEKLKLRFKLSARDLKDKDDGLGVTDPYVELYYTEGSSNNKKSFARTTTISDSLNPSWGETFEFDYDRSKAQKWYFKVKDHDTLREDDTAGRVWVTVQDYVEKGQQLTANLDKKGTLTISAADPNQVPKPVVSGVPTGFVQPGVQPGIVPVVSPQVIQPGVAPAPGQIVPQVQPAVIPVSPVQTGEQPQKIRFKLSARGLPDTDLLGTVDPFVKAFYTGDGTSGEVLFGRTAPISDKENPDWTETFDFDYYPSRNQKWRFLVLDQDDNRRDDEIGNVIVPVSDFAKKGSLVIPLSKGSLNIQRI